MGYIRSVFLQADKEVFDVTAVDVKALAVAMGLPGTPKIKFTKAAEKKKNLPYEVQALEKNKKTASSKVKKTRIEKILDRKNQTVLYVMRSCPVLPVRRIVLSCRSTPSRDQNSEKAATVKVTTT